jgi:hypothetical protein
MCNRHCMHAYVCTHVYKGQVEGDVTFLYVCTVCLDAVWFI